MEPVYCPRASARSYHYSLRNDPEERSSLLLCGGSMKSRKVRGSFWTCCRGQNSCLYHDSTLALLSHKFYRLQIDLFHVSGSIPNSSSSSNSSKGKAVPLQVWSGPEVSRKLSSQIIWQRHRMVVCCQPYAPAVFTPRKCSWYSFLLETESTPRAIVRSEGFYFNEKFQWHQLGSNQRPSDLYHSTLTTAPPPSPSSSSSSSSSSLIVVVV